MARPLAYAARLADAASVPWACPWKNANTPMIAAPDQRGALRASATTSPRPTPDDQIGGPRSGTATPATAAAKPASIVATNAIGHTPVARPPAIAPHTPTATMARRWSAP